MSRRGLTVLAGAIAVLALAVPTSTQSGRGPRAVVEKVDGRDAAAGEVLVRFNRPMAANELAQLGADADADSITRVGRAGLRRLKSKSLNAASLLARLANRDDVAYVEPNYIVHALATPNDPSFGQLWGLTNTGQAVNGGLPGTPGADIHAAEAWDVSVGSTSTVVGVIDTGIDYTHPDLAANIWSAPSAFTVTIEGVPITCPAGSHGFNAVARNCDPMDDHYHGTHVAGTIGAVGDNGVGVAGINWTTRLMGIKFLDANGSGTTADAINSVEFAIQAKQAFAATGDANIRVLSNSWGGYEFSQALLDEVNAANASDMLFVAGAGNDGIPNDFLPFYPASFDAPNVISVAASDNTDNLAWFSNWGTSTVHLAAPGVDILSAVTGGGYDYLSGTSMATPHVSGAAALVLSRCALDTADLKETLLGTVEPVEGLEWATITGGRLDVNSAIHSCIEPPATPANLAAAGGEGKVTLTWSSVSGAMRYSVKRSLTAGGPYAVIAADVNGKTYIDSAVVNDTTYYYVITASNSAGESGDSNEASATPRVPPDLAISSLTVPSAGAAGATIAVSETTRNQGSGAADPSTTRFYLSSNSTWDASDLALDGIHDVPALAAGATSTASLSILIPVDTAPGARYVIARADADGVVSESHETNNTVARSIQIGPDLVISALAVPGTASAGATIAVTDTVKNKGGATAAASVTAFYLSTNTNLDAGDLLLAPTRAVASLAAGVSSVATTTVAIPSTVAAGTYYVIAVADADNVVSESLETNNDLWKATLVGGDLIVSALSVPAKAAAGSDISVTETTTNQGAGGVSESITRFYLSVNTTVGTGDTLLSGSHAVPDLAAGASHGSTTVLTIPPATTPGTYYVIARADADNLVIEVSDSNNTMGRAIQLGADLIVTSLSVPSKAVAGADLAVTDTTTNQGGDAAAASTTRFYLSANSTLDANDTLLEGSRAVPDLAAGAGSAGSTSVTIPSSVTPGTYYVIAKADAENFIAETQESNNTLGKQTTVGGDLVVSAFTVPGNIGAGSDVSVTDTTTNQASGGVGASSTRFYLSVNTALDAADTLLAGSHDVPALAAGAASSATTTIAIPPTVAAGTYYLIAKADGDGVVGESSEGNNTMARTTDIGGDLIVSGLTVPAKAGAGSAISVSETATNQGGGAVAASVLRFYLSSNTVLHGSDPQLGSRVVPDLAGGAASAATTTIVIPSGVASGTYYVIAKADADNVVIETVENNNIATRSIQIGPDLVVSALTMPSKAPSGSAILVTDTATNQGGGAAAASTTRFYLSTNPTFDSTDTLLAEYRSVPDLAAGAANAGSTTVTLPSGLTPKTYYVIARADADDVVDERAETNNTLAKAISITAP